MTLADHVPNAITASLAEVTTHGTLYRVSAEVDGRPLWFESSDVPLRPATEVYADPLIHPAMERQLPLHLDGTVDPVWYDHALDLMNALQEFWGHAPVNIRVPVQRDVQRWPNRKSALLFDGGVDAFYSLLKAEKPPALVVFPQGFEIPPADEERMDGVRSMLLSVAAETGANYAIVRTNLREHPTLAGADWGRTMGGAMSSIGHLLTDCIGTLIIPATVPDRIDRPAGSHVRLDKLHASTRLNVVRSGGELYSHEKLWQIAEHPLVRSHLRVCDQPPDEGVNCSRCDACLRAMLPLAALGMLDQFPVFKPTSSLHILLDATLPVDWADVPTYRACLRGNLDRETRRALRELLRRTGGPSLGDKARRWAKSIFSQVRPPKRAA